MAVSQWEDSAPPEDPTVTPAVSQWEDSAPPEDPTVMTADATTTDATTKSNTLDLDSLKQILRHLLRQMPVSEAEQQALLSQVDELHITQEQKKAAAADELTGAAPPGWSLVDGKWVPDAKP